MARTILLKRKFSAVTLIELLIALVLLSLITLGFSGIEVFSRFQVASADRRTKVQNEVSYLLEHMSKNLSNAIGNEKINGAYSVVDGRTAGSLKVYVDDITDLNGKGQRDATDDWIEYKLIGNQFSCGSETLSIIITNFSRTINRDTNNYLENNSVTVFLTGCWDSDGNPFACGTTDNPSVQMQTEIKMPSVSTN